MTDLSALIAELEAAPRGSRELDDKIWCVANNGHWFGKGWRYDLEEAQLYTTSCTAARTLVPEELCWEVEGSPKTGGVACVDTVNGPMEGIANTPALALCIAALKARQ